MDPIEDLIEHIYKLLDKVDDFIDNLYSVWEKRSTEWLIDDE